MDIIVVGAGVVGCAVAHALASRGARVRILDARGAGQGATRASAGILAPYIEGDNPSLLTLTLCSLGLYDEFIDAVQRDSARPVEYRRNGTLQVAVTVAQEAELETAVHVLDQTAVEYSLLDRAAARRAEPGLTASVSAALLIPAHGYVAAPALTTALAAAAVRHGAVLSTDRVTAIEPLAAGVEVMTPEQRLKADAVVVAAGSWSTAGLDLPFGDGRSSAADIIKPVRGQLLHLRFHRPPASRVLWGNRCYIVPWHDGSVLVGATMEDAGFNESATAGGVHQLLDAAVELLPATREAGFGEVRVGLRPKAADGLPAIGRSSTMPSVFYAMGHYRSGVLLAPLTAALIADLVIDGRERPELALVRPARLGL